MIDSEIYSCAVKGPSQHDNCFECALTASSSAVDTLLVTTAAAIVQYNAPKQGSDRLIAIMNQHKLAKKRSRAVIARVTMTLMNHKVLCSSNECPQYLREYQFYHTDLYRQQIALLRNTEPSYHISVCCLTESHGGSLQFNSIVHNPGIIHLQISFFFC